MSSVFQTFGFYNDFTMNQATPYGFDMAQQLLAANLPVCSQGLPCYQENDF